MTDPVIPTAPKFSEVFAELTSANGLSEATTRTVFDAIFAGSWTPAQIGGFLVAVRQRGETAEIIAGAARAMRSAMVPVPHGFAKLLDTCGTGGDGSGSLNLSTGAALVAAAAGVRVAKHGNRAATSRSGSADVLESLGIPLDLTAQAQGEVMGEAGIAFLFAIAHHPAMRHAMPVRRELGVRTLFNLLGPLSNPAGVTHHLLGAPDDATRLLLAQALVKLGSNAPGSCAASMASTKSARSPKRASPKCTKASCASTAFRPKASALRRARRGRSTAASRPTTHAR